MPQTVNIPLSRLAVGEHQYPPGGGGVPVADSDSLITLSIDRTVSQGQTQGFDGQPATTTAEITAWQSNDGGGSWFLAVAGTVLGGHIVTTDRNGNVLGTAQFSKVEVPVYPGTGRQVRASVTVAGATVAVAGSLTTS